MSDRPPIPAKLIVGLAIIAAGVLFTLDNLDFVDAGDYIVYWPVALIAIGLTRLGRTEPGDIVFQISWIGLGGWFLLYNLDYVDYGPFDLFWPIVLIVLGVTLTMGALRRRSVPKDSDKYLSIVSVLSGADRKNSSNDFRGGDLTAVMGGGDIDLRGATIAGAEAEIQVFAMWGGYEIKVPEDWRVVSQVVPLLGGIDNSTTSPAAEDAPILRFKGWAIMGGLEVTN